MKSAGGENMEELLDEQVEYYRAVAAEYESHALPFSSGSELSEALDAFRPAHQSSLDGRAILLGLRLRQGRGASAPSRVLVRTGGAVSGVR
jgi:demethylmenaquinone methyltransferase/2-methoxy-6-polyprenyl-1,4-benzoquinol methylase